MEWQERGVFWPALLKRTILIALKIFTNRHKDGKKNTLLTKNRQNKTKAPIKAV